MSKLLTILLACESGHAIPIKLVMHTYCRLLLAGTVVARLSLANTAATFACDWPLACLLGRRCYCWIRQLCNHVTWPHAGHNSIDRVAQRASTVPTDVSSEVATSQEANSHNVAQRV
jgi:hypothetical protein